MLQNTGAKAVASHHRLLTTIGWKIGGLAGACVALAAMCAPAALLAFWLSDLWERFKARPWRAVASRAMAPMVIGLILSGGFVLATPDNVPDWRLWLIAAASAAGMLATKLNPLWLLAAGGILGALLL